MNTLEEYDFISDDFVAWEKYPRYNWMYNTTRLLDAQNIHWSPFRTKDYYVGLPSFTLGLDYKTDKETYYDGFSPDIKNMTVNDTIFVADTNCRNIHTEALIRKGSLKWFKHFDPETFSFHDFTIGEIDLRISAFITLYFKKFNGVVSFETSSNHIIAVKLYPTPELLCGLPHDVVTQLKKITPKKA